MLVRGQGWAWVGAGYRRRVIALMLALALPGAALAEQPEEPSGAPELEQRSPPAEERAPLPLPPAEEGEDELSPQELELTPPKKGRRRKAPPGELPPGKPLPLPEVEEEVQLVPPAPAEASPPPGQLPPAAETGLRGVLVPDFVLYRNAQFGAWIKPVVRLATGLVLYIPSTGQLPDLTPQVGTLLLGRLGFEGELVPSVGFKLALERSLGFTYDLQGPGGTSVWEGQGEFQPREMYLRLSRWGFTITGGIVRDYDTFDFVSVHTLDFFAMDPFIRGPLLASGMSEGQGAMVKYEWHGLRVGFSYTGGQPVVTSLAGAFGGNLRLLPLAVDAPLSPLGSPPAPPPGPIHLQVFSPTLSYHDAYFDVRTAAQVYLVDTDLTRQSDPTLAGYNLRATARVKLFAESLVFFGGFSYRHHEQPDPELGPFEGIVGSIGADYTWRNTVGLGGSFSYVEQYPAPGAMLRYRFINVGATYWIVPGLAAVGLRYARVMPGKRGLDVRLLTADSLILSARLSI